MLARTPPGGRAPGLAIADPAAAPVQAGLARRLFLRVFPVVAGVVLVTQLTVAWVSYSDQLRAQSERARLLAQLTASAVARPVWNLDDSVYRPQIESLALDSAFLGVRLLDDMGKPMLVHGQPDQSDAGVIRVSAELRVDSAPRPVGRLELVLSTAQLRDSAIRQVAIAVAAVLVLVLVFTVTLQAAVRRRAVLPLRRLLAAMREVEHKRWTTVETEAGAGDEIGAVSTAFNRMVEGLRSGDEAKQLLTELEAAHQRLGAANRLVLESINYARRIQASMLPDERVLLPAIADVATLWQPLHTVGGDYFWVDQSGGRSVLLVVDCTGHGVPGAFMTLVVAAALDRALGERGLDSPAAILVALDAMVRSRLRQNGRGASSDDGLDCAICVWDRPRRRMLFAGAGLPLLHTDAAGAMQLVKGGRHGLGYRSVMPEPSSFVDVEIAVAPGMAFYLCTDGVSDQMGGSPRRLLGRKRLAGLLQAGQGLSMTAQMDRLEQALAGYRGPEPLRDDMTAIGFIPLATPNGPENS
ncbi:SpoIIE family protein phosphatase [Roseomonas sp. 18066]|uniref:SpoIIE family protein phosphatase n=1 Tax=Roseomonas sp. 18066 TaxID=2681412 RepID=UPI00190F93B3|nr:SpoIIE family protein phosphatase [Roseomonas sp. 18066]